MKAYSIYKFVKDNNSQSKYILDSVQGFTFDNFPYTGKVGKNKGIKSISFQERQKNTFGNSKKFTHCFMLGKDLFTSFNLNEQTPSKAYGDNKSLKLNDCVLIEFSNNSQNLTLYFYRDCANISCQLFEKWITGQLSTELEKDIKKPIEINQSAKMINCFYHGKR